MVQMCCHSDYSSVGINGEDIWNTLILFEFSVLIKYVQRVTKAAGHIATVAD